MISKDEIEAAAETFEIHISNVERDYVFGWLLAGIYTISALKDVLILKGGNCFRKAYFPYTRFSGDLDFSSQTAVDAQHLETELNAVCDFVQQVAGVEFVKDRNSVAVKPNAVNGNEAYQAKLFFKDFYGNPDIVTISVRLDVSQFDRIYLPVQSRYLVHPYSDAEQCRAEIRCYKLEELLATKLKCLLQRRHSADLYDYVYSIFINRDIEVNRGEVLSAFLRKTIFERSPGVARGLLLELPFDVIRGYWQKYIVCPVESVIDFDIALDNFKANIQDLFGSYAVAYGGERAFFPANLRNPIMEAGSTMTLLEIVYSGVRRLVEPYSLVYKRRQDGVGQEYFYVYDRTGGASGPGIKALINSKIQSIKNTDEKFEPQFSVELSKAGEPGAKTYFGSPFSNTRSGISGFERRASGPRRTPRKKTGMVYTVACSYCGKHFQRSSYTMSLNDHKDKYGNRCFGRVGYLVSQNYKW